MTNSNGIGCALMCWLVAALGGALTAVLLMVLGDWGFLQAAFIGAVAFVLAGTLLSWILCKPLPALGEGGQMDPDLTPLGQARAENAAPSATATAPAAALAPAASAAADTAASAPAAEIKPSTQLPGQEELASRKGTWKYEGGTSTDAATAKPASAPTPAPEPAPVAAAAAEVPAGEEKKPEQLSFAREGGPDDLKMIKGVGPKLEALLHTLGFFHFDQIASWQAAEVAWVDQNLQGFKGRVSRDNWVDQAKLLAAGGETEFSQRVEKGGVYE